MTPTPTLPPHTAEVLALFAFPLGADASESVWWRYDDDGAITFYAKCSDTFMLATADCERIEPGDVPLLRRCLDDLRQTGEDYFLAELFASRKRGCRPLEMWLDGAAASTRALFEAAGPSVIDPWAVKVATP